MNEQAPNGQNGGTFKRSHALHRLLLLTLDPVHIGTGGAQLGGVDLSIIREPGTRLPKIPGTTLNGVARAYAAYRLGKPQCAGAGATIPKERRQPGGSAGGQCGEASCPVCFTFGSLRTDKEGDTTAATAGTVNMFDAHILLFPVASSRGPLWVGTAPRLRDAGFDVSADPTEDKTALVTFTDATNKHVNLGWLLLGATAGLTITLPTKKENINDACWTQTWDAMSSRIALVTERMFSQIVNSNLEVRTSVSIDPNTGAAKKGALFSYEAIPRATLMTNDFVEDVYRPGFDGTAAMTDDWLPESPFDIAKYGLETARLLGLGGMGTRGFGRVRLAADWTVEKDRG